MEASYPSCRSDNELAERFAHFFTNKILAIRNDLSAKGCSVGNSYPDSPPCTCELHCFKQVSIKHVEDLVASSAVKSCVFDTIPASVLKSILPVLLPVVTKIVNLSLETATMADVLKEALLNPLVKKANLNFEEFSNFRPDFNLKFISKATEKAVAFQLNNYIRDNDLGEVYQSAYKKLHSTETALLRVHNDILRAIDLSSCY